MTRKANGTGRRKLQLRSQAKFRTRTDSGEARLGFHGLHRGAMICGFVALSCLP